MYKLVKLTTTVIAILSIICCVPAVSAIDTTEPTEQAISEQATEAPTDQINNHDAICCILLAIGVPSGCLIAQGFSFWKW